MVDRPAPAASGPAIYQYLWERVRVLLGRLVLAITSTAFARPREYREDIVLRWFFLIRRVFRVRRAQRLWGNLGQYLQLFGEKSRDKLRELWPAPSKQR